MKSKRVFINHSFCIHLTRSCTVNALCRNLSHCGIGILADHRYCLFIYNKKEMQNLRPCGWLFTVMRLSIEPGTRRLKLIWDFNFSGNKSNSSLHLCNKNA